MGLCNGAGCPGRKRKRMIILLVGLDNAGKTCTAKCLLREPRVNIAPTVGFSIVKPKRVRHDVTIYDLGGGQRIRGIWKCYFAEAYGLIYVVDASDTARFAESREALHELIGNPNVSGKPMLLLANKQDERTASDEIDICEALDLETVANKFKCRTKVETCSATAFHGKRFDRAILKGFKWLIDTIAADYSSLSARVGQDMELQREVQKKEQAERAERIRLLREQREKSEGVEDDGADGDELANPFRPINEIKDELDKSATVKTESKDTFGSDVNTFTSNDVEVAPPLINGFMKTANESVSEGFEVETTVTITKSKKKRRLGRNNKTAPMDLKETKNDLGILPPLQLRSGSHTTVTDTAPRPSSGVQHSWGLAEELEPIDTEHPLSPQ